jgi:hypothetical protein
MNLLVRLFGYATHGVGRSTLNVGTGCGMLDAECYLPMWRWRRLGANGAHEIKETAFFASDDHTFAFLSTPHFG